MRRKGIKLVNILSSANNFFPSIASTSVFCFPSSAFLHLALSDEVGFNSNTNRCIGAAIWNFEINDFASEPNGKGDEDLWLGNIRMIQLFNLFWEFTWSLCDDISSNYSFCAKQPEFLKITDTIYTTVHVLRGLSQSHTDFCWIRFDEERVWGLCKNWSFDVVRRW